MPKTFTWGNALAKGGARRRVNAGGGRFGSTTLRLDGGEGDVPSEPRAKKEHTVSVDDDEVSAEHLLVFLEDGLWYAQGLSSTNGTVLVSGADGAETLIEPPRSGRVPSSTYPPVRIDVGDVLRLGSRTSFLVVLGAKQP